VTTPKGRKMPLWGKSTPAPVAPAAAAAGASSDDEGDDDDEASRQRGRLDGRTWLDEEALNVGVEVQIHSLTSATEHNGSRGELGALRQRKGALGRAHRHRAKRPRARAQARQLVPGNGAARVGQPRAQQRWVRSAATTVLKWARWSRCTR
jgi:hypothetical protein